MKEVTVFTNGDSGKLSTWSNVPYFFTETLVAKGVKVNRINLNPDPNLEKMWDKTMGRVARRLNPKTTFNYFRSLVHFVNVRKRIKKALKAYPNSEANIFLTFSFSAAGLSKKPNILFCDWTYDHYFKYHAAREPDLLERQCINRENEQVEAADLVLPLFPGVADYMKKIYRNQNIFYLGNVINSKYNVTREEALSAKQNSDDLLFVGSGSYMEGALRLVKAFENLKKGFPKLKLHIVGMEASAFKNLPQDVFCYGYLDKGNDSARVTYYELFKNAKIFINTTPKWGAFSATIEAMYFYNPVIVAPYAEFVETFGSNINFGTYCEQNEPGQIEKKVEEILSHPAYSSLCLSAHDSVKEFTWDAYIDKVIKEVTNLRKN